MKVTCKCGKSGMEMGNVSSLTLTYATCCGAQK
jgi:hypothetical protein